MERETTLDIMGDAVEKALTMIDRGRMKIAGLSDFAKRHEEEGFGKRLRSIADGLRTETTVLHEVLDDLRKESEHVG